MKAFTPASWPGSTQVLTEPDETPSPANKVGAGRSGHCVINDAARCMDCRELDDVWYIFVSFPPVYVLSLVS